LREDELPISSKKIVKPYKNRNYLAKDFDGFRAELLEYARVFFPDKIKDFSEASMGGLLLDFASFIGDSMSHYLDHQFNELDPVFAVENKNIQSHLNSAGIKVFGRTPAVVDVEFLIKVSRSSNTSNGYIPDPTSLPTIKTGTIVKSNSGIEFSLTSDLDFSKTDPLGNLVATKIVSDTDANGFPLTFILSMTGQCVSGESITESFEIENVHKPFRKLVLSKEDITEIISVTDSNGDEFYEVDSLVQDVVYKGVPSPNSDNYLVDETIEIIPAPRRYVRLFDVGTRLTSIQFGSGNADTIDDDIIPDPSEFSIPLYGKKTFSRFSIDPNNMLNTSTLGISPKGTTVNINYRYGGGLRHNVGSETIRAVTDLNISFNSGISSSEASSIRKSVDVINRSPAQGGEDPQTIDELRSQIFSSKNAQSRIVTKPDLLSRVYTMPSNFGRVFRAGIRSNPENPLATQLFVISRDQNKNLVTSPDTLKQNLEVYLNQFRMISDAIDIVDAPVINLLIEFKITSDINSNKVSLNQKILSKIKKYFKIENFQIDQPIMIDDIRNLIYNETGVSSVVDLKISSRSGVISGRSYSDVRFDVDSNTRKGFLIGPPGSIFEVRYPDNDIVGSVL